MWPQWHRASIFIIAPFPASVVHRATIYHERLAGHEIAIARGEEYERTEQVFRIGVALEGAAVSHRNALFFNMSFILEPGIAQDEAGRKRIDRDTEFAELARQRAGQAQH